MQVDLIKVHGSENEFFILDETLLERTLTQDELVSLTKIITDRNTGLLKGADGVLLVGTTNHKETDGSMRVINYDGSEASMCGNGLRTVARYLSEKNKKNEFVVETMHADLHVKKAEELGKDIQTFQVEISPVSFNVDDLPFNWSSEKFIDQALPELATNLRFSAVAVPNPHLISFVDHETLYSSQFEELATYLNGKNPYFPDGVNVSFVEVLDKQSLFVRTFERGVGFTNACGTAMAASSLMYVLLKNGQFEEKIQVINPGGMVQTVVHKNEDGTYWMDLIGNATYLNKLSISLEDILTHNLNNYAQITLDENENYHNFLKEIEIDSKKK
ncbi:diaminopimelate epimerase [Carnobacterium sp.]|uniref:diaminopimelate epimerase n=1 Tax=Carnobacterium sp. TaxID=48221 RepID=UPI003890B7FD